MIIAPMRRWSAPPSNYRVRRRGMGDAVIMGGTPLVQTPTYQNCDPRDTACVMANQSTSAAYGAAVQQAQAANNFNQCTANANNAASPEQYAQVMASCNAQYAMQGGSPAAVPSAPPPPAAAAGGGGSQVGNNPGTFRFTTSGGDPTRMSVGDTWNVSITGASPGTSVSVRGLMPTGQFPQAAKGRTDGSGNFSLSGSVGTGEVGYWQEIWSVGPVDAGQVAFTVMPLSTPATPAGKQIINSGGAAQPPSPVPPGPSTPAAPSSCFKLFGDMESCIGPVGALTLALGAGVALFAFGGGRGR